MRKLFSLLILSASFLLAQTAQYPGAIVTPQQLGVAVNNAQSSLLAPQAIGDTVAVVVSAAGFENYIFISLDSEIEQITNITGNVLTVTRGFDGTAAAAHAGPSPGNPCPGSTSTGCGASVSAYIIDWFFNALGAEMIGVQTALGTNLANAHIAPTVLFAGLGSPATAGAGAQRWVSDGTSGNPCTGSGSGSLAVSSGSAWICGGSGGGTAAIVPLVSPLTYQWSIAGAGGGLSGGTPSTQTVAHCPVGFNAGLGTATPLWISGGAGSLTPEAVSPSNTSTCTSGATGPLTIVFTPATNHGSGWSMSSATAGVQEAECANLNGANVIIPPGTQTLNANVTPCGGPVNFTVSLGTVLAGAGTLPAPSANNVVITDNSQSGNAIETEQYFPYPIPNTTGAFNLGKQVVMGTPLPNGFAFRSDGGFEAALAGVWNPGSSYAGGANHTGTTAGVYGVATVDSQYGPNVVGVFGSGTAAYAGKQAWGANFAVGNCAAQLTGGACGGAGSGVAALSVWGVEVDMNLHADMSGAVVGQGLGTSFVSDTSTCASPAIANCNSPSGNYTAVQIGLGNSNGDPANSGGLGVQSAPWTTGIQCNSGACQTLLVGMPLGITPLTAYGSPAITLYSIDALGNKSNSAEYVNSGGNWQFFAPTLVSGAVGNIALHTNILGLFGGATGNNAYKFQLNQPNTGAGTQSITFGSSGLSNFDSSIIATGGSGSNGTGNLALNGVVTVAPAFGTGTGCAHVTGGNFDGVAGCSGSGGGVLPGQTGTDFALAIPVCATNCTFTVAPGNFTYPSTSNPSVNQTHTCTYTAANTGNTSGVVDVWYSITGQVVAQWPNSGTNNVTVSGTNCSANGASAPAFPTDGSHYIGTVTLGSGVTFSSPVQFSSLQTAQIVAAGTGLTQTLSGNVLVFTPGSSVLQTNIANVAAPGMTLDMKLGTMGRPAPATLVATIGTSCTSSQMGQMFYVTDATTPTIGSTVAGSGAAYAMVNCNGSAWTVTGK
jgi:hypothetical protein